MKYLLHYMSEVIAVAIVIIYLMVGRAMHSNYSSEMEQLESKAGEMATKRVEIERWKKLKLESKDLTDKFLLKDESSFRKFVEGKALDYSLSISSLIPTKKERKFYTEVTIGLKASTSYDDLVGFIDSLVERGIHVVKISLNNASPDVAGEMLVIDFILNN